MDFHGRAAAHKPKTMRNAMRQLEWCEAHWTLEQRKCVLRSDESLPDSLMEESGIGGGQENITWLNA